MNATSDERMDSALYWTAVSLIVCEGVPVREAARILGVKRDQLLKLLRDRTAAYMSVQPAMLVEHESMAETRH